MKLYLIINLAYLFEIIRIIPKSYTVSMWNISYKIGYLYLFAFTIFKLKYKRHQKEKNNYFVWNILKQFFTFLRLSVHQSEVY